MNNRQNIAKAIKESNTAKEPLCKTCLNAFHFPECCSENLMDCIKIITYCPNYEKFGIGKSESKEAVKIENHTM